ncbi:MAG TPA: S8 family serine peptidase [Pyrinomonadaceae bacterium]|jgi:subtilisin family serine protease|nr:S8 family serine peptidase [Pyrinomonadaceae bacterium]
MRSILTTLALALALLAGLVHQPFSRPARAAADPQKTTPGVEMVQGRPAAASRAIVRFRDEAGGGGASQPRAQLAAELDLLSDVPVGGAGARLVTSRTKTAAELVAELSARPDVLFAEPDLVAYGGATPNDPSYPSSQYALRNTGQFINGVQGIPDADIDADEAWDISTDSRNQVVAVLDSGIDYNHPDLTANVWSAPAAFSITANGVTFNCPAGTRGINTINNTCDPLDDHNHGTNVSGIIGASGNNGQGVAGVNWQTTILPLKWLNANNSGFLSDAIDALEVAVQLKQAGLNIRVLNNSWFSGGFSQALLNQINRVEQQGMLFVAISGNGTANNFIGHDNDTTLTYPSSYKTTGMLTVAATNNRDELTSFSNWGKTTVHMGAPGQSVFSTLRNSTYGSFSGTSQAAPHVAGSAALLLSRCNLSAAGLKGVLITTGDPVASLADKTTSGSRLNVARALSTCNSFANISDEARFFVRQQYVDFLNREPDASGLAHWTNVTNNCGDPDPLVCRINVSAGFFLSIEFTETGYLVERTYKSAYGDATGTSTLGGTPHTLTVPVVRFEEFLPDTQRIGQGVVVLAEGWEAKLESNKVAFFQEFVQRARFLAAFPTTMTPTQFVDQLNARAGGPLDATERQNLINELTNGGNSTAARASVLRKVAEDATLADAERNRAFVLMQYFGYLRRNPNDAPEQNLDYTGYDFWLGNLNHFNGNFVQAELVKAFITSDEYRKRFVAS